MVKNYIKRSTLTVYFLFIILTFIEAFITPTVVRMVTISLTDLDIDYLIIALVFSIITSLILIIGKFGKRYFYGRIITDFKKNFKYAVFNNFLCKDIFDKDFVASALDKDVNQIINSYIEPTLILVSSIGFTLVSIMYALFTNFKIGILFITFYSIPAFFSNIGESKLREKISSLRGSNQELSSTELDFLNGFQVIKNYKASDFFLNKYKQSLSSNSENFMSFEKSRSINSLIINTISSFTNIAPILIGAKLAINNFIKIDEFLAVYLISYNIGYQFSEISYYLNTRRSSLELLEKFDLLFKSTPSKSTDINNLFPIVFDNVSFSYGDKTILSDLSFQIDQGDKVAVIGQSGLGKSTILKLIFGILTPDSGEISFGGNRLNNDDISVFSTYIMEDSYVFNMTSNENVSFDENNNWQKLKDIFNSTNISYLINKNINNDSVSGGERQRIEISRALYSDKKLILADEIKSNLDSANSKVISDILLNSDFTLVEVIHHYNQDDLKEYSFVIDLNNIY